MARAEPSMHEPRSLPEGAGWQQCRDRAEGQDAKALRSREGGPVLTGKREPLQAVSKDGL